MTDPDEPVRWRGLAPGGTRAAAEATQFIAAPLLAGAAIATIGVVAGADGAQFRWPGPAMLALTVAAISLVTGIQLALRARHYLYSKAEVEEWHGPLVPSVEQLHAREQALHLMAWRNWYVRSYLAYNVGVALLGVGVLALLAPAEHASVAHSVCRWIAVTAVGAAVLVHVATLYRPSRRR
ncbi:hypothetical protein [Streptomyces phaeofaciens]|uniref:hypothetical protein n=1 Tax=Streptomyces phaeofaciens TaxID=68254 RepID=UPI001673CADF|nr:hypothetical protein [Streptomyces phaeofaciens]